MEDTRDEEIELASLLVIPMDSSLVCSVCLDLIKNAVYLTCCGNSVCELCLKAKQNICPFCKTQVDKAGPNIQLRNFINNLRIKCRFGCNQEFTINDRLSHEKTCSYVMTDCPNGCSISFLKKELDYHLTVCTASTSVCKCGQVIERSQLQYHLQHECENQITCTYCGTVHYQKESKLHNENCQKRKIMVLQNLTRDIDQKSVEEILQNTNTFEEAISIIKSKYDTISQDTVFEIYNLPINSEPIIIELLSSLIDEKVLQTKVSLDWSQGNGTWLLAKCADEQTSTFLKQGLLDMGFPYVRSPIDEITNEFFNGRISHLTFCPPLNKMDCPIIQKHSPAPSYCPFRHKSPIGPCKKWKIGFVCDHPNCIFEHSGKTVHEVKFVATVPNVCKYCQAGRHFGWQCSSAQKQKVIKVIEKIIKESGGEILLSQLGAQARQECEHYSPVLQKHYHNKLRKLLEDCGAKFLLMDLDKPGAGKVRLYGFTVARTPFLRSMSPSVTSPSQSPIMTPPSPYNDTSDGILVSMSKNRTWSPKEIYDFVWGDIFHYFEDKSINIKTHKSIIPHIQKLLHYIEGFTPSGTALNTMKEMMRDIANEIACLKISEHESSISSVSTVNFDLSIEKLKFYGDNLCKPLKKLQQQFITQNNILQSEFSSYLEGDSLLAVFHYTKLCIESYHSPIPASIIVNQLNNLNINSAQICSNCGRLGHATTSCNRCSNCTRMHATHLCTQPYPSCGYCHVTKRASSQRAHSTQGCPYLKADADAGVEQRGSPTVQHNGQYRGGFKKRVSSPGLVNAYSGYQPNGAQSPILPSSPAINPVFVSPLNPYLPSHNPYLPQFNSPNNNNNNTNMNSKIFKPFS